MTLLDLSWIDTHDLMAIVGESRYIHMSLLVRMASNNDLAYARKNLPVKQYSDTLMMKTDHAHQFRLTIMEVEEEWNPWTDDEGNTMDEYMLYFRLGLEFDSDEELLLFRIANPFKLAFQWPLP